MPVKTTEVSKYFPVNKTTWKQKQFGRTEIFIFDFGFLSQFIKVNNTFCALNNENERKYLVWGQRKQMQIIWIFHPLHSPLNFGLPMKFLFTKLHWFWSLFIHLFTNAYFVHCWHVTINSPLSVHLTFWFYCLSLHEPVRWGKELFSPHTKFEETMSYRS